MAKLSANFDHARERLIQRVREENRESVARRLDQLLNPPLDAPSEMVGHYEWHVDVNDGNGELAAQILGRGIWVRTVYGPLMEGGMGRPHQKSVRYRIDKKTNKLVKA